MKHRGKRIFIAIVLFLGALGAAFAEPRAQRDPFRQDADFSMAFPEGVVVKNQEPVFGYEGRIYKYGDTCIPLSRGNFHVLERLDGFVIVLYTAPKGDVARHECPSDSITTFRVKDLEYKLSLFKAKEAEDQFTREFQRRMYLKPSE